MSSYHKRSADSAGIVAGDTRYKSSRTDGGRPSLGSEVSERLESLYKDGLVQPGDFDDRALTQLSEFSTSAALDILDQFASCDMSSVRNKSAYLSGVMQRMRKFGGGNDQRDPVQRKLNQLYEDGVVKRGDLDQRCLEALHEAHPDTALLALERFANRGMSDVRNPSAFFMSTLKKVAGDAPPQSQHHQQQAAQQVTMPPLMPGMPGGLLPVQQPMLLPGAMPMQSMQPMQPPPLGAPGLNPFNPAMPLGYNPFDPLQSAAQMQAAAAAAAAAAAVAATAPNVAGQPQPMMAPPAQPPLLPNKTDHGNQQRQFGVRVDEFWNLSEFARYVHPAPALKLQQLWDEGVRLVSLLDDRAWELLSELGAAEGLIVVEDVARQLQQPNDIRNVNAFFMSVAKNYTPKGKAMMSGGGGGPHGYNHSHGDRPAGGGGGYSHNDRPSKPPPGERVSRHDNFHLLPTVLADKVDQVLANHPRHLTKKDFDDGVVSTLNRMPLSDAVEALAELDANDLSTVRNMAAYIMGICRRFVRK